MKVISFIRNIDSDVIRSRLDIIKIILHANEYLINEQYSVVSNIESMNKTQPFLYVDKMSRLFISEIFEDEIQKIYSITFPFAYNINQRELSFNQIEFNNSINSCLKSIISNFDVFFPETMEKILEICWEACKDNEFTDVMCESIVTILTELLTFDVGYIRYDYDEEHQNGVMHPLYHLDINYSNRSTYKIGLRQSINSIEFKSILDINQECWFVQNE